MTDLSTLELRDLEGYEWIVRPERTCSYEGFPWQGVVRNSSGNFETLTWTDDGSYLASGKMVALDLVPPPPGWRHVRLLDGLLMRESQLSIATHRYDANKAKKGEAIVLEPV